MNATDRPLTGIVIVTTRDQPGDLDRRLAALGADVLQVPLIEIVPADDDALARAVAGLSDGDWVVVSSQHGAELAGAVLQAVDVDVRTAAVGTRTATSLERSTGRRPDVVPSRQTAADLVAVMPDGKGRRVLLAQADRAAPTLADGLARLGYDVIVVTAYRTALVRPTDAQRDAMLAADVVAFASGSAAEAWADAVGTETPAIVAAIGPTTAAVAASRGLTVTQVAVEHDVPGLVDAVVQAVRGRRSP